LDTLDQLADGFRLVAGGLEGGVELKVHSFSFPCSYDYRNEYYSTIVRNYRPEINEKHSHSSIPPTPSPASPPGPPAP
jgi:hypothetical protein